MELQIPSAGRLTVSLELKAINDKGMTTFDNTLVFGEMKPVDTIALELAIAAAVNEIGKMEYNKITAEATL